MKSQTNPEIGDYSLAELDSRFGIEKWIVPLCMVAVGTIFAVGTHVVFAWLNRHLAAADGPTEFRLLPQSAIWWFFPGFGALALSYEIVLQAWSFLRNPKDPDMYNRWWKEKSASRGGRYAGLDSRKVLRKLALIITLPVGALTVLALPMHTSLLQHDIRDCGYAFAPCRTYSYAEARRMTMIEGFRGRDGKLTRRAGIVLDFSDGRSWSSADTGDFQKKIDSAFAKFLTEKTQLPLNYAETAADIPRLTAQKIPSP